MVQFGISDEFGGVQLGDVGAAVVHEFGVLEFVLAVEDTEFGQEGVVDFFRCETGFE